MSKAFQPTKRLDGGRSGRLYETEAGTFPSVTNILSIISKPALMNWYASQEREMVVEAAADLFEDVPLAPKMSRVAFITSLLKRIGTTKAAVKAVLKAGEIGTECHALIEWNLRRELGQIVGDEPKISPKAAWAFASWQKWRETVNLKPIHIEQAVYSSRNRYAGTLDLVAELDMDGGRAIAVLDWKTGKAIYPEASIQIAAYSYAYCEMGHAPEPPPGIIVRLPKVETDPDFEALIVKASEINDLVLVFLNAYDLWNWQQKAEAKRKKPAETAPIVAGPIGETPALPGMDMDLTLPPGVMPSRLSAEQANELKRQRR